jgi:hypothetical protein
MSVQNDQQVSHSQAEDAWTDYGSDFVLIAEGKPPPRIELARERMLICRLYLGLMRTITDDYGAEFAAHSDSLAYRTIGIYVFLRTVMCSPVRASQIAHALKLAHHRAVARSRNRGASLGRQLAEVASLQSITSSPRAQALAEPDDAVLVTAPVWQRQVAGLFVRSGLEARRTAICSSRRRNPGRRRA